MSLVICNKAMDACKNWCLHSEPHEIEEFETGDFCTNPGYCVLPNMEYKDKFKVKCVKVKKKKGDK